MTLRPPGDVDGDAIVEIFTFKQAMWDVLAIPVMPDDPHDVARKRIADTAASVALEVAWAVHPSYQGRGLAFEAMASVVDDAFAERDRARLAAITDPKNRASRSLMKRLGFVFDADIQAHGVVQVRDVLDRDNTAG